jgi:hypothetical protein
MVERPGASALSGYAAKKKKKNQKTRKLGAVLEMLVMVQRWIDNWKFWCF